jgi:hypothetical protein
MMFDFYRFDIDVKFVRKKLLNICGLWFKCRPFPKIWKMSVSTVFMWVQLSADVNNKTLKY